MFFEFFHFLMKKGSFLDFYWSFSKFKNCFGITMGIFGGVKEKEKINSTTPCGFKKCFLSFSNFWWKRGLFWIFIGLFWNLKIVLESQLAYLGGSKKRKKSIWPLLMALKKCFFEFLHFFMKKVFFWFFLEFFKI